MQGKVLPSAEDNLRACISAMRTSLVNALQSAIGTPDTTGACLYGCILVRLAITQWAKPYTAAVRGGGPLEGPELGLFDGTSWRGHYWVEVQLDGQPIYVADISADQFGLEPLVLMPWAQAQQVYRPGEQQAVDEALAEELARVGG